MGNEQLLRTWTRDPSPGVPSTLTPRDWGLGVLGVKHFPEKAAHSSKRNADTEREEVGAHPE